MPRRKKVDSRAAKPYAQRLSEGIWRSCRLVLPPEIPPSPEENTTRPV